MLGVSPDTLRAWERRHRALTPARSPSGQRRYTLEDVARLRQIKYERHAHRLSLRLATMTAQGLVPVAEGEGEGEVRPETPPPTAIGDTIRVVLNLIREVVLVLDEEGSVVWANLAFAKFTDRLASRIAGSKFVDFVDPYDRAKAVQAYTPGSAAAGLGAQPARLAPARSLLVRLLPGGLRQRTSPCSWSAPTSQTARLSRHEGEDHRCSG